MNFNFLIADDHFIVRAGTSLLLQSAYPNSNIVFAENYEQLQQKMIFAQYDLVILDIDMPGSQYKKMINNLRVIQKDIKILIFSGYPKNIAMQYIKEGANGYVSKEAFEEEIKNAVDNILKTGFYFSSDIISLLVHQTKDIDPTTQLSSREYQIFELFAQGNGNLEICNILNLQKPTVSTYKKRIFEKLQVKNIAELIKIYEDLH